MYLCRVTAPEVARLKLILHYDGSRFHGWQSQPDVRTVQGELEAAVERLTGRRRAVTGSGRTDTGVHATGQVAAVDVPAERWSAEGFLRAMNAVLPGDVWVADATRVGGGFHPRYHAVGRTYVYRLGLGTEAFSPFHRGWCWALGESRGVDRGLLDAAAAAVPGERSFEAFAKAGQPERGTRCHVRAASWGPWAGPGIELTITADRYLHHMVRYLVGTMVDVARGRRPLADMTALLTPPAGPLETSPPAPPEGLFLARVEYPEAALSADRRPGPEAEIVPSNPSEA